MSGAPLIIEILFTFIVAAFLLHRYGDLRKQRFLVTLACFISWYFSLMIIFILPLDVSLTFYRQCIYDYTFRTNSSPRSNGTVLINYTSIDPSSLIQSFYLASSSLSEPFVKGNDHRCDQPRSYVPDYVLPSVWRLIYWTSQVLTWLVMPLMQSYCKAGDFTVLGKIKSALIQKAILYGTYLSIFGVCLMYVAIRPDLDIDREKLKIIGITASHTWGLTFLVIMLGYGLVAVPRSIWNKGRKGFMLYNTYFKIAKLRMEKIEAEESLEDVIDEIKSLAEKIDYNHPLKKHMDVLLKKCPQSAKQTVRSKTDDYESSNKTQNPLSKSNLIQLHKKVIKCTQINQWTSIQWEKLINLALDWEEIEENMCCVDRVYKHSDPTDGALQIRWLRYVYTPTVEWYWICKIRPYVYMGCAAILTIVSFMVVWSECLFFIKKPVLSLFALLINDAKENYQYSSIELVSILTLAYLCFCTYFSVFRIRIFNLYYIAPHHQTNEHSLIFIGMMLCRLIPPMCVNFLGLIRLDSRLTEDVNIEETFYTQIMGRMDVIAIISNGFNIYFPILIVLLCIFTFFRVGGRILDAIGLHQFIGDDDMTQGLIDEGRELVAREKTKIERKANVGAYKKNSTECSSSDKDNIPMSKMGGESSAVHQSADHNEKAKLLHQTKLVDYQGDDVENGSVGNTGSSLLSSRPTLKRNCRYQSRNHDNNDSERSWGKLPRRIFDDA